MSVKPERARAWLVVFPALIVPFAAAWFYFVLFSASGFAQAIYAGTKGFILIWPLLASRFLLGLPWPRVQLRDPRHRRALPLGLATGLGLAVLAAALTATPLGDVVVQSAPAIRSKARSLGFLDHYWAFALLVSLIHSLLEEYYWRWFVFGRLQGLLPRWRAHLLAAGAFAAHHIVVTTQFFPLGWGLLLGSLVGVGGFMWSWMYEHQQTLAGAWVSHILVDLGILAVGHWILFGTWF
jgi:CAAX protease family protein